MNSNEQVDSDSATSQMEKLRASQANTGEPLILMTQTTTWDFLYPTFLSPSTFHVSLSTFDPTLLIAFKSVC